MTSRSQVHEPIIFYLPYRRDGITSLPSSLSEYWSWLLAQGGINKGKYSWTLQTYMQLREAGVPCSLSETFPSSGIVVSHRDFLPIYLPPRPDVFLVCIKPDRKKHTWAHYYIVQNERDGVMRSPDTAKRASAIRYWPQPSMIVRDPARGSTCEHAAYLGRALNLAPELKTPAWQEELRALGLRWSVVPTEAWNDYSAIDVTVSVRSFGEHVSNPIFHPDSKPPSKLVNSWLAGVPAILGAESAYQSIRQGPLDYLEVNSVADLRDALRELRQNPSLHRDMVDNGRRRARDFAPAVTAQRWREVFQTELAPTLSEWRSAGGLRRIMSNARDIARYFLEWQNVKDLATVFKRG